MSRAKQVTAEDKDRRILFRLGTRIVDGVVKEVTPSQQFVRIEVTSACKRVTSHWIENTPHNLCEFLSKSTHRTDPFSKS